MRRLERGSASVELAMVIPLILALLVVLVEVAAIGKLQIELVGAAREGVRVAATSPDPADALAAVNRALGERGVDARVAVRRPHVVGYPAEVEVSITHRIGLPLVGEVGVPLSATAVMRVEQ